MVWAAGITSTVVYTYNAAGLRVAQSVDGEEITFAWDLAAPLAQVLAASDDVLNLYGLARIGELRGGEWDYPLPDALGSVRQWTDGAGSVDYAGGYTPFGVGMWQEGSTASAWGYIGEHWDDTMGLLYLRARWYEPEIGRFTQRDLWPGNHRRPQTRNGWNYADGDPINSVDLTGLYSMKEIKEVFGATFYDPDVLDHFRLGGSLEGRWGWLQVLRKAEDGNRLIVFEKAYCLPPSPTPLLYPWPFVVDIKDAGVFRKEGASLSIGGTPHMQVALGGYKYEVHELTHRLPHPRYGEIYDPIIQHWEFKAGVVATHQYMGLRCDVAKADWVDFTLNVVSLALILVDKDELEIAWDMVNLAGSAANAGSREDAAAALHAFLEEANMLYAQLLVKYGPAASHPAMILLVAVIDAAEDALSAVESAGCQWLP